MMQYSIEPEQKNIGYGFLSFARKYKKKLFDTALNAFKKVGHKAGEFLGNKIPDSASQPIKNLRNKNLLKKQLFHQKKK